MSCTRKMMMMMMMITVLLATSTVQCLSLGMRHIPVQKCTGLELKACSQLGYNRTRIIPQIYLSTRRSELFGYFNLLRITKCSNDLLFFICMMYQPICFEDYNDRILPCRSVCENVKASCLHTITMFGFQWPDDLNCNSLPDHNTGVCIKPSAIVRNKGNSHVDVTDTNPSENSVERVETTCPPCRSSKDLTRFKYYKRANYAIKAVLESRSTTSDGHTTSTLNVIQIFKRGTTMSSKTRTVKIYSKSQCTCPRLNFDQVYYILGREDKQTGRLLFDDATIAQPFSKRREKKITKYARKFKSVLARRKAKRESLDKQMSADTRLRKMMNLHS